MEGEELVVVVDDERIDVVAVDNTPTQKGTGDDAGDGGILGEMGEAVQTTGRRQRTVGLRAHGHH